MAMMGSSSNPTYPHGSGLSALRTPPLRMAEKAGAWGGEPMPPPLGGGRGHTQQRTTPQKAGVWEGESMPPDLSGGRERTHEERTAPEEAPLLPLSEVPAHVAIIMDGNGRWARQRGLPRMAGPRAGTENIRRVIERFADY